MRWFLFLYILFIDLSKFISYDVWVPVTTVCTICKTEFHTKLSRIKKGWGKYCSKKCNYIGQKTGKKLACHTCKKEIYRSITGIKKSASKKFFCSKSCQTKWRNSKFTGNLHSNWRGGMSSYREIMKRSGIAPKCARCNTSDIRTLTVHHKDKNRKNNHLSNLMWLCHNCHFLVHRYKNEGKGYVVPVA